MNRGVTIRVLINSSLEEVLSWKCCNLHGMNLELQVVNGSAERMEVKNAVALEGPGAIEHVDWLYPPSAHVLLPGEALSFYGSYDEERFKKFSHIIIEDGQGRRFRSPISGDVEQAEMIA